MSWAVKGGLNKTGVCHRFPKIQEYNEQSRSLLICERRTEKQRKHADQTHIHDVLRVSLQTRPVANDSGSIPTAPRDTRHARQG